jgi:hypothetical protein
MHDATRTTFLARFTLSKLINGIRFSEGGLNQQLVRQLNLGLHLPIVVPTLRKLLKKLKLNSVAFSLQANYTERATAACRRS